MARIKGFTITESIIAMVILSSIISIGSFFTAKSFKTPNRSEIIQVTSIVNKISQCQSTNDFNRLNFENLNPEFTLKYEIIEKPEFADVEFFILQKNDTLFQHFIILQYEN